MLLSDAPAIRYEAIICRMGCRWKNLVNSWTPFKTITTLSHARTAYIQVVHAWSSRDGDRPNTLVFLYSFHHPQAFDVTQAVP
jgi:hypothetical protein